MPTIEYSSISDTTDTASFVCGLSEIEKWFRKSALVDHLRQKHIVTCATYEGAPDDIVGLYALSTVVEDTAKLGSGISYFPFFGDSRYCPALQIVYMAIRRDLQGSDQGTIVLGEIVKRFATIGEQIGIPALILTPSNPDAARFYKERGGFAPYKKGAGMFLPLQSAIATLEAAAL